MEAHHHIGGVVDPHGGHAHGQQAGIVVEQQNERPGEGQQQRPDQHVIAQTGRREETDALPDPAVLARAIVVADDRLGSLGQAADGLKDDLTDGDDGRHGRHVEVAAGGPAIGLQLGVAQGLHQTVGDGEGEACQPQAADPAEDGTVQPQTFPVQPQDGFSSRQEQQDPYRGTGLGDDRG